MNVTFWLANDPPQMQTRIEPNAQPADSQAETRAQYDTNYTVAEMQKMEAACMRTAGSKL